MIALFREGKMDQNSQKSGFSDVDRTAVPDFYVQCLNEQYAKNSVLRANKKRTFALSDVQVGHIVLDAGCGTGVDALSMAYWVGDTGHVYGIDSSHEMIKTAQNNAEPSGLPITFQQSGIYDLPFADNMFDRTRSDKVFQHLRDPQAALAELIRVTKPGGKIIIADPDHDSLIIDTPFTEINRRFTHFRSEQLAQGGIAHQQYALFKQCGLIDVYAEPLTTMYTNYDEKKITSPYLQEIWIAQKNGVVSEEEAMRWAVYVEEAILYGRFMCMQTYIITTGIKPKL